jgi:hypothetical protein
LAYVQSGAVASELPDSITESDISDNIHKFYAQVAIPADDKCRHGATPTTALTHIAICEQLNGKGVDWLEKVNDEQYRKTESNRKPGQDCFRVSKNVLVLPSNLQTFRP